MRKGELHGKKGPAGVGERREVAQGPENSGLDRRIYVWGAERETEEDIERKKDGS